MTHQTRVGIAVMALSLSTGGGGAMLVKRAHAMPAPRDFPPVMGWLLIGCAAFGLLLAAGLAFWVDRDERTA